MVCGMKVRDLMRRGIHPSSSLLNLFLSQLICGLCTQRNLREEGAGGKVDQIDLKCFKYSERLDPQSYNLEAPQGPDEEMNTWTGPWGFKD